MFKCVWTKPDNSCTLTDQLIIQLDDLRLIRSFLSLVCFFCFICFLAFWFQSVYNMEFYFFLNERKVLKQNNVSHVWFCCRVSEFTVTCRVSKLLSHFSCFEFTLHSLLLLEWDFILICLYDIFFCLNKLIFRANGSCLITFCFSMCFVFSTSKFSYHCRLNMNQFLNLGVNKCC